MMKKMMLLILTSMVVLTGCATTSCSGIKSEDKKIECNKANKRFHDKTGWRYDRPHSRTDR